MDKLQMVDLGVCGCGFVHLSTFGRHFAGLAVILEEFHCPEYRGGRHKKCMNKKSKGNRKKFHSYDPFYPHWKPVGINHPWAYL